MAFRAQLAAVAPFRRHAVISRQSGPYGGELHDARRSFFAMRRFRASPRPVSSPPTPAELDAAMVALAATSYAVLDVPDLRSLGMSTSATYRRVDRGRLYRLHQGVYSIVPPELLKPEGRWLAAVKAVGSGAGLSWPHAGALWALRSPPSGPVHVAVPGNSGRRRRQGIVVHRCLSLRPEDVVTHNGIPVTSLRRTLEDARSSVSSQAFDALLRRAEKQQLNTGKFGEIEHIELNQFERRFLCAVPPAWHSPPANAADRRAPHRRLPFAGGPADH